MHLSHLDPSLKIPSRKQSGSCIRSHSPAAISISPLESTTSQSYCFGGANNILDGPDVPIETTSLGVRCVLYGGCTLGLTDYTWRQVRPRLFQSLRFPYEASYNEPPINLKHRVSGVQSCALFWDLLFSHERYVNAARFWSLSGVFVTSKGTSKGPVPLLCRYQCLLSYCVFFS